MVRTADASSVSSTPPLAMREEEVQTSVTAAVTEEEHNTLRSNDQVSRTQKWCLLKSSQGEDDQGIPTPKRSRRVYHCGECGKVRCKLGSINAILMNIATETFHLGETGHIQHYGVWYCPFKSGQIPLEEWKEQQRIQRRAQKM